MIEQTLVEQTGQVEPYVDSSSDPFHEFLENNSDAITVFDQNCRCVCWNKGMERISGIGFADAMGRHLFDLLPGWNGDARRSFYQALSGNDSICRGIVADWKQNKCFDGYYYPLRNEEGLTVAGVAIFRNITGRAEWLRANTQLATLGQALELENQAALHNNAYSIA